MEKAVFDRFRSLIYQNCGITLSDQKEALVASRLGKRMRQLGIEDFGRYYEHVTHDSSGEEMEQMINAISTNVTHFFRERRHFDYLAGWLQTEFPGNQREFRVWCAAASSGEEPYTIAITALENLPRATKLRMVATDISTRVLETARFGVYKEESVQAIPPQVLKRYFRKGGERAKELVRVKASVREMIEFRQVNLATPPYAIEGGLDAIFCRNVMIYFNTEVRRALVDNMIHLLRPGGLLFVGMAESLSALKTPLISIEPSAYRKPG